MNKGNYKVQWLVLVSVAILMVFTNTALAEIVAKPEAGDSFTVKDQSDVTKFEVTESGEVYAPDVLAVSPVPTDTTPLCADGSNSGQLVPCDQDSWIGPQGLPGEDSTVPGPPGADSTVPGPPGPQGKPGPPGIPGIEVKVTESPAWTGGGSGMVIAWCPPGSWVLGGGATTNPEAPMHISSAAPSYVSMDGWTTQGWEVHAKTDVCFTGEWSITAIAYCLDLEPTRLP